MAKDIYKPFRAGFTYVRDGTKNYQNMGKAEKVTLYRMRKKIQLLWLRRYLASIRISTFL